MPQYVSFYVLDFDDYDSWKLIASEKRFTIGKKMSDNHLESLGVLLPKNVFKFSSFVGIFPVAIQFGTKFNKFVIL